MTAAYCESYTVWMLHIIASKQCDFYVGLQVLIVTANSGTAGKWDTYTVSQVHNVSTKNVRDSRCDSYTIWEQQIVTATRCDSYSVWELHIVTAAQYDSYIMWQLHSVTATQYGSNTLWQLSGVTATQYDSYTF